MCKFQVKCTFYPFVKLSPFKKVGFICFNEGPLNW